MALIRIIDINYVKHMEYQSDIIPRVGERISIDTSCWYVVKHVLHVVEQDWAAQKNANVILHCERTNSIYKD